MANQFAQRGGGASNPDLTTPMTARPASFPAPGGTMPGDKDGMEALKGAAAGGLASPMHEAPYKQVGPTTAGSPVKLQVTEDVQAIEGKHGGFPTGTATRV